MFQISRRVDYAIRIMIELGLHYEELPMPTRMVSKKTGVPKAFLHKITADLVKANLLQTQAGPTGGLTLRQPIDAVNVLQVVEAVDGPLCLNICLVQPEQCNRDRYCPAHDLWGQLQVSIIAQLSGTTLDMLVGEAKALMKEKSRPRDHIPYLYAKEDIQVTPPQDNQSAGNSTG